MKTSNILKNFLYISILIITGCQSTHVKTSLDANHAWVPTKVIETSHHMTEPLFATSECYTLPALLELGLSHNPQTRTAWWQARKALAQKGLSEAAFYPTITGEVGVQRQQTGAVLNNSGSKIDNWGPSLKITYRLFQFGVTTAQAKQATYMLIAANYSFNQTLQTVVFNIQKAYCDYASAVANIQASEASLNDTRASYNAVKNRETHGLARKQDVLLAQADMLQAEYALQAAQSGLEACRAELALAVGVPVSKNFNIDVNLKTDHALVEEVEDLMRSALKQRSDVLAAEANVEAAYWDHLKTRKADLPALDVMGTVDTLRYSKDSHWQRNYSLGLGISWNLFSGFDSQYKALASQSALKEATFQLQQQKLQTLRDVWAAFHAFQSSSRLLESAKALEIAANESLNAVRTGYEVGLNSLLDLLSAQKTLSQARLTYTKSQSDLAISWARLAYVSGRLTSENFLTYE